MKGGAGRPAPSRFLAGAALAALLLTGLLPPPAARAQAPGDREGLRSGPRAKRDHEIQWREWGRAAFDEARRDGKLVLLDLTAVWCHWCHVMDETSYSDSEVIRLLNAQFIPIRVDADRYPQVTDRYISGGWPTTAVLTPEGHVLASRTYVPPEELRRMLPEIREFYRNNRREIERKVSEMEREVEATWRSEPPDTSGGASVGTLVDRTLDVLRESEDRANGGFGTAPKFHNADAVSLLLREGRARRDPALRAMAQRAVDGALRLEDSVWGGFYRYATSADWKQAHYEKMLEGNAAILRSLVEAFRESGDRRYAAAAVRTLAYANRWLGTPRHDGWFGSQDADVGSHDPAAAFCAGEDYYGLTERSRRRVGLPHVDSTVFADANARMAGAVLAGARARAYADPGYSRSIRVLDRLWRDLRAPDGSLYHAWARGRGMSPGLLADQAAAGLAYLDAYEATGDTVHLARARALRAWIRGHLEDSLGGGFRYGLPDSTSVGRARAGERTPGGSVDAATLALRLHWLEGDPADLRSAQRTMAWLRSGETIVVDPARAILARRLEGQPVRIAVVGRRDRGATAALREVAFRVMAGDPVIRQYDAGGPGARWGEIEFPASPSPAIYVCGDRACSPPITDPRTAGRRIEEFLGAGFR